MIHGRFLWDLLAVIYSSFIYLYLTSSLPDLDLVSPYGHFAQGKVCSCSPRGKANHNINDNVEYSIQTINSFASLKLLRVPWLLSWSMLWLF